MNSEQQDVKVSVYCLAYNHEKYIRQTLEGFVMQKTNFPFEVFVHDDASTDGTADIIREYEEKYGVGSGGSVVSSVQYRRTSDQVRSLAVAGDFRRARDHCHHHDADFHQEKGVEVPL